MKSYYSHLTNRSLQSASTTCHRSSAIFPVFHSNTLTSRLLFLNYWDLKNKISFLEYRITLRSKNGVIISQKESIIDKPKAYLIELIDYLPKHTASFLGSIEIEFLSAQNLRFPYPAVVVNYYGDNSSVVVHSAQRIYNDTEDFIINNQTRVPEGGFNIYATEDFLPFISLINGSKKLEPGSSKMSFFNAYKEQLDYEIFLPSSEPYSTTILYPSEHVDLRKFLKNLPGTMKLDFASNGTFPRLIVGNINHSHSIINVTHTYYDLSHLDSDTDYWQNTDKEYYPSTLMIPLKVHDHYFTNVNFYPILSPTTLLIDVEIRDTRGHLLAFKEAAMVLSETNLSRLEIKPIVEEFDINTDQTLTARLIARPRERAPLPTRIKIGLDIGIESKGLPCNICVNMQPANPSLESKPSAFRWSPICHDHNESSIWLLNSSQKQTWTTQANLTLNFYRQQDDQTIRRNLSLAPQGSYLFKPDQEIKQFLNYFPGWCTIKSDSPYLTTFYFFENPGGIIGGDHGF